MRLIKPWRQYSKKNQRRILIAFAIALIGLIWWHYPAQQTPASAVAVSVATAHLGTLTPQIDTIGTIVAVNETQIKSQVSGQLTKILVTPGQTVKQGDVLFIIDQAPFQASLNQAIALANKDQATANFSLQQLERYGALAKAGYVSKDFFSQILANAKTAKAAVIADQAAVANARLSLAYCTITAPISGRLGDILPNIGDLISSTATTNMVSIKQFAPIEAQFSLPAKHMPLIRQALDKMQVIATSNDDPHLRAVGTVDFIDNQIDVNTDSVIMKALFTNSTNELWPGQLVQIQVSAPTQHNAVLIPNEAIRQNQQGEFYVYRISQDHKACLTTIKLGASTNDFTAVQTGLQAGDKIVTQGQFHLSDGALVKEV